MNERNILRKEGTAGCKENYEERAKAAHGIEEWAHVYKDFIRKEHKGETGPELPRSATQEK